MLQTNTLQKANLFDIIQSIKEKEKNEKEEKQQTKILVQYPIF